MNWLQNSIFVNGKHNVYNRASADFQSHCIKVSIRIVIIVVTFQLMSYGIYKTLQLCVSWRAHKLKNSNLIEEYEEEEEYETTRSDSWQRYSVDYSHFWSCLWIMKWKLTNFFKPFDEGNADNLEINVKKLWRLRTCWRLNTSVRGGACVRNFLFQYVKTYKTCVELKYCR